MEIHQQENILHNEKAFEFQHASFLTEKAGVRRAD
jgi:hypothetical protein